MYHTPAKLRQWVIISAIYMLVTTWVVWYSLTCEEMFCGFAMLIPALPWSFVLSYIIDFIDLSFTGWVVVTYFCAFINVAIVYILLSNKAPGEVSDSADRKMN